MKKLLLITAIAAIAIAGCKKKPVEPEVKPQLSVTPTSLSFTAAGETKPLTVTANKAWTLSGHTNATWLTVSATSGNGNATVNITAAENTATMAQSAKLVFTVVGTTPVEVVVTQQAAAEPEPVKTVTVGEQQEELTAGEIGEATFAVATENIVAGETITLNNTNSVAGISLETTATTGDNTIVNIGITAATPAGSHPLTLTIDGITSEPFALEISEAKDDNFAGKGKSDDPYLIYTAEELALLAELVNNGNTKYNDKHYKLMNDIDLSAYGAGWNDGKGWIPIGAKSYFKGNFNGNNHKVSELYINSDDLFNLGLFGAIDGGTVRNLGVEGEISGSINVTVYAGTVGGVAGAIHYGSNIINCYVNVNVATDFVSDVITSRYIHLGGVVGEVYYSRIENCFAAGSVSFLSSFLSVFGYVGGVAGFLYESSMANCYSTSSVSGKGDVGGVAGMVNKSSMTNCYATGEVNGIFNVGGVAGNVNSSSGRVENCAALNPIVLRTEGGNTYFGRVAGVVILAALANNVAWLGMVLIGENTETSEDGTSIHGADITTAEAKTQATYIGLGWAFGSSDASPWKWGGVDYPLPVLYWQDASTYPTLPWHLE